MIIRSFTGDDSSPLPENVSVVPEGTDGGFPDGKPSGRLTGVLRITDIAESWAAGSIQLTLYRPTGAIAGGVEADDAVSLNSPEREYGDRISMARRLMLPQGITHIILDINPMRTTQGNREFDFSRIREFTMHLGATQDAPVYLRHLRLCVERDTVGAPAVPVPGDSISCLQNQDQSCYTYELENVIPAPEVQALQKELEAETGRLQQANRVAQIAGRQTLYVEAAELVAKLRKADAQACSGGLLLVAAWCTARPADGAIDVIGAEVQRHLRNGKPKHHPIGFDVFKVVEEETADGDGAQAFHRGGEW